MAGGLLNTEKVMNLLKTNLQASDGASQGAVRRHNRGLVLRRVFETGAISRTQLAADSNLTGAAISRITRELLNFGLLQEGTLITDNSRPGRKSIELNLPASGVYVVGVGAGAYEQWVRISTIGGDILARRALKLIGLGGDDAIHTIVDAVDELLRMRELKGAKLIGCGVAVAGVVDPIRGELINSSNFGWRHIPIAKTLKKALGMPIRVESLHHALNLAEVALGQSTGLKNILLVNAALGIGASIFVNGSLLRGKSTSAGQIGHMIVDGNGEVCTCGRRGCLDTVASGHAVLTHLGHIPKRAHPEEHRSEDAQLLKRAMDAAHRGDEAATAAFKGAGRELGKALLAIKMVTDPECIVIAGPLAQINYYILGVREALESNAATGEALPKLIVSNQQMDAAGAWLALESLVFGDNLDPSTFRILT